MTVVMPILGGGADVGGGAVGGLGRRFAGVALLEVNRDRVAHLVFVFLAAAAGRDAAGQIRAYAE